jgi:hypothetical protein
VKPIWPSENYARHPGALLQQIMQVQLPWLGGERHLLATCDLAEQRMAVPRVLAAKSATRICDLGAPRKRLKCGGGL